MTASFREWLLAQRTDKNPLDGGISGPDLAARLARRYEGRVWETAEELHRLFHTNPDRREWMCDALADARDEYAVLLAAEEATAP